MILQIDFSFKLEFKEKKSGKKKTDLHFPMGHFRVPPDLCFKTRVGAESLLWKSFFILMQIKLIFTRKVAHLASF